MELSKLRPFDQYGNLSASLGMWLSLVERLVRDEEVGGSNPLIPTKIPLSIPDTWVTSCSGDIGYTMTGPNGLSRG